MDKIVFDIAEIGCMPFDYVCLPQVIKRTANNSLWFNISELWIQSVVEPYNKASKYTKMALLYWSILMISFLEKRFKGQ